MTNEELVVAYQRGEVGFEEVFKKCEKLFYKEYNKYVVKFSSVHNAIFQNDDIYSLSLIGVYNAAQTYDPNIAKFSTYLALKIKESVMYEVKRLTVKKRVYNGEMIYLDSTLDDNSGELRSQYHNLVEFDGFKDSKNKEFIEFCAEILEKTVQKQDVKVIILNHLKTGESLNSLSNKTRSHQTTISREFAKFKSRLKFEYMKMEMI